MSDAEDRTQAPSERRRARARDEGQAPLSKDLVTAAGLAAFALVFTLGITGLARSLIAGLESLVTDLHRPPEAALRASGLLLLQAVGPLMLLLAMTGAVVVLLQTGFLLNTSALMPVPSRLDPRRGLKRVFGLDNGVEALKSIAKLGLLCWAAWSSAGALWAEVPLALTWDTPLLMDHLSRGFLKLLLAILVAQALIALLDTAWTRLRFTRTLRMSREELRQESKEADGDPRVKARVRQLRQARARKRMLADVARATVVVTNPTHYAVALLYERGGAAAPRIVAKGMDEVAARIREAAARANVPLVTNPPLARALHALPLDQEVPSEHFKVVAEIIAYVWRLRGHSSAKAASA